ncbi:SWIM-type domain-containing protein, partial [Aphis craccivora]
ISVKNSTHQVIPSDEVKSKILKLFEEGKTPSKALFAFKLQLRVERGNNYYVSAGDRGELPDPQWVYYLYYKMFKKNFGVAHGNDMMVSLNEDIEEYNTECKSKVAAMKILDDGNFAIAILTPLMKRISVGFDECGQILFIDASANVDRYGCKVFMIYTNSCAGGLPVGTIILTSESTSVISVGLELWKSLFPLDALGGRGLVGPKNFMSDDSTAERNALHEAFPQSELLLCIFHILQAAWRYLWDYNHDVPLDYRQTLYLEIKNMVYSKDKDELETTYNNALQKPVVKQFPKFVKYLQNLYQRRQEWAICFRKGLITRGQNTNNISEADGTFSLKMYS